MPKAKNLCQVLYGRTPQGQLLYDLGFTRLGDRYLAKKHAMPLDRLRALRVRVRQSLEPVRRQARRAKS